MFLHCLHQLCPVFLYLNEFLFIDYFFLSRKTRLCFHAMITDCTVDTRHKQVLFCPVTICTKSPMLKGVYLIFRLFPFAFFFTKFCNGYKKMVIYHFYNTDRCHLTPFLRVLICYEALLSIIII